MNNLTEIDNKVDNIDGLEVNLFEHQKTAIYYMSKLENEGKIIIDESNIIFPSKKIRLEIETNVGILADKVGSGKSNMIIGLLLLNKEVRNRDIIINSTKNLLIRSNYMDYKDINILVVPYNILFQWENYVSKSKLRVFIIDKKSIDKVRFFFNNEYKNYDLVIISNNYLNKSNDLLDLIINNKFKRFIIDEVDTLSISNNLIINACFIWLITGTPTGIIYNRKGYLNNIFKDMRDWVIDYLLIKNNDNYIEKSIILEEPNINIIKCKVPLELKIYNDLIPENAIRMINAGNIEEAIKLINYKEDNEENIFEALSKNIIRARKNKIIELRAEKEKEYDNKDEQYKVIKRIENIIERLDERYETLKKRLKDYEKEICQICLNELNNACLLNCCNNIFCFDCITITINNNLKCPMCKKRIDKNNIIKINNNKESKNLKSKNEELINILKNNPNGNYLIFSDYYETFEIIKKNIEEMNINYYIIKNEEKDIERIINEFKNNNIKILMMNAKYYGAGLNLEIASDIIMYHRFDNELEKQIIGRAQRIGRKNKLNVYILDYK